MLCSSHLYPGNLLVRGGAWDSSFHDSCFSAMAATLSSSRSEMQEAGGISSRLIFKLSRLHSELSSTTVL